MSPGPPVRPPQMVTQGIPWGTWGHSAGGPSGDPHGNLWGAPQGHTSGHLAQARVSGGERVSVVGAMQFNKNHRANDTNKNQNKCTREPMTSPSLCKHTFYQKGTQH